MKSVIVSENGVELFRQDYSTDEGPKGGVMPEAKHRPACVEVLENSLSSLKIASRKIDNFDTVSDVGRSTA